MIQPAEYSAIIPAAGKGTRMGPLPHSKELLSIGTEYMKLEDAQLKPVAGYLFERIRVAGVRNVNLVLRKGKSDLMDRFQSGREWGVNIAYHVVETDLGVPFTVNQAVSFCKGQSILFGFPDILFSPADALLRLKQQLEAEPDTDVLLGLFPVAEQHRYDTVILSDDERISDVRIKEPSEDPDRLAWILAAWKPMFSDFLRTRTSEILKHPGDIDAEVQMGAVFRSAIRAGLTIKGQKFLQGACLDIGTPEGYKHAENFVKKYRLNAW
jgi:glucose-1-phosphate thymidylyltransferase